MSFCMYVSKCVTSRQNKAGTSLHKNRMGDQPLLMISAVNCLLRPCIVLYLSISIALLTARAIQKCSRPQQWTQATASEGLAQGPHVIARGGFKLTTLWSKVTDSTKAPPRPTYMRILARNRTFLK